MLIIAGMFISAYVISLYSLVVYLDPDELTAVRPNGHDRKRDFIVRLAKDPRAFTQLASVYKSFVLMLNSILTMLLLGSLSNVLGLSRNIVLPIGLLVLWGLYLVVAEYLPRRSARKTDHAFLARYLWLVISAYVLFLPVITLYRKAMMSVRPEGQASEDEKEEIVERAIETLADNAGIGETIVEEDEKKMIGQIFLLDQTVVREIMVPRIDITGIEKSMSFRDIQSLIRGDGHSRFPVYEGTIDRIIGILYVKDLFVNMPLPGEVFVITDYIRKPYFVPESKVIGELLREFKMKKLHIAIVVDEYGGVAGLVTLEDVIEEIVGEIQDEHDLEEAEFVALADGSFLVEAGLLVEDLQDRLGTDYQQGTYDTVGGMIYDLVGSVPHKGAVLTWHDLELTVISLDGQRIKQVRIARKAPITP